MQIMQIGATAPLLASLAPVTAAAAAAEDVTPSGRVSSAVLVRQGLSTDTAISRLMRGGD